MADKARQETDKKLRKLERRVNAVYKSDPSLQRMQEKYKQYMNGVKEATMESYLAYKNAPMGDERNKLKKAYINEVRDLTINNQIYKDIVKEFARIMAVVNQKALDLSNDEMDDIYCLNYNQVAVDCKKVGIKVENNG